MNHKNPTALLENRHRFDIVNPKILANQPFLNKRILTEIINVFQKEIVNTRSDMEDLTTSYLSLLSVITM